MQGHGPGFVIIIVVAAARRARRRECVRRRPFDDDADEGHDRGDGAAICSASPSALVRVGLAPLQGLLALDPGLGLAPGHLRLAF